MTFRRVVQAVEVLVLAGFLLAIVLLAYKPAKPQAKTAAAAGAAGTAGAVGGTGTAGGVDGNAIFVANCSGCHGSHGQGSIAPQLTGGAVARRYPNAADERLIIANGRDGMPSWSGRLSPAEIDAVVAYTRQ